MSSPQSPKQHPGLMPRLRALGAALIACAMASPAWAVDPVVTLVRLTPNAGFVRGLTEIGSAANANFVSNAGFVVTADSVVVVDALGSPPLGLALLQRIRRETGKPVSHVILTHYHADHIYGLQAFKAAGARIVAHRRARDYLDSETARIRLEQSRKDLWPWVDENTTLVAPDQWVDARSELVIGGVRFVLLPAGPSHTPEDLAVHVPGERVLYSGDLVFAGRIPWIGQADSRHWIQAIESLFDVDVDILVPGHGPESREPRRHLELTRDYLAHLRATMGEAARNLEPFDDAYRRTDWSRFAGLPLFDAANRMNAFNTFLLLEQER